MNKRNPRGLRLDPDIDAEVKKIAELTDLPESEVIRQMVRAGVRALKANNYDFRLPLTVKIIEPSPSQKSNIEGEQQTNPPREVTRSATLKRKSAGLSREEQQ